MKQIQWVTFSLYDFLWFCDLEFSETGKEFIKALKEYKDDDEILQLVGRHVIEEHTECDNVKHKFADYVHKSGNYPVSKQKWICDSLFCVFLISADQQRKRLNVTSTCPKILSSFLRHFGAKGNLISEDRTFWNELLINYFRSLW